jgi:acyl carrier protein
MSDMPSDTTQRSSDGTIDATLLERVCDVAARTFGVPRETLHGETAVGSVEAWNSLGHLRLMMSVESEFGVRFHTDEIGRPRTIDELCRLLAEKVS